jgi:hypothetical protein
VGDAGAMEFGLEQGALHRVWDLLFRPTIILHFAEKKQVLLTMAKRLPLWVKFSVG